MKFLVSVLVGAALFGPGQGAAASLPLGPLTAHGVSPERLARLNRFMQDVVAREQYLGAVTLVARNGTIIDWQAYGHQDAARRQPMQRDSIFRIYSMTKTVTAVAVLTLMEEGKLGLEDPVGKYLPDFAQPKLFAGGSAAAPKLRPAENRLTIRHLLTHTPGFAVYGKDDAPVNALFARGRLSESADLKDYAARLARLPLAHEPGEQFHYDGVATQLLGRLVEVVAGMPFDQYLKQRIFDPLSMSDTGFSVPAAHRHRIAAMTTSDKDGKVAAAAPGVVPAAGERMNPYLSGAGGLYSTAGDYARFAQMLLNGGTLDGASILGRKTVELMMQNHLSHLTPPTGPSAAEGFGLGGSVLLDPARRGRPGSVGQFGWSGAAATYYTIDPRENLVAILMLQHLPLGLPSDPPKLGVPFYNLVYQSLVK